MKSRFNDKFQINYPMYALRSILNDALSDIQGLRPPDEHKQFMTCDLKTNDPSQLYKLTGKLGKGAFGTVYKA